MDPVTAIANAAGKGFDYMSNIVTTFFGYKKQRKLLEEQTKQLELLTEQERIRYDQLIADGNDNAAMMLLLTAQQRQGGGQTTTYLIIGGLMLAVILIIILKSRKK